MEMRPRVSSEGASGILTEIALSNNTHSTHPLFNAAGRGRRAVLKAEVCRLAAADPM